MNGFYDMRLSFWHQNNGYNNSSLVIIHDWVIAMYWYTLFTIYPGEIY